MAKVELRWIHKREWPKACPRMPHGHDESGNTTFLVLQMRQVIDDMTATEWRDVEMARDD
jgi:hypothetical protein